MSHPSPPPASEHVRPQRPACGAQRIDAARDPGEADHHPSEADHHPGEVDHHPSEADHHPGEVDRDRAGRAAPVGWASTVQGD